MGFESGVAGPAMLHRCLEQANQGAHITLVGAETREERRAKFIMPRRTTDHGGKGEELRQAVSEGTERSHCPLSVQIHSEGEHTRTPHFFGHTF